MSLEFRVTIRLGNDAMQSGQDIAAALERVAESVREIGADPIYLDTHAASIRDANGNRVGQWKIREDPEA